MINGNDSNIGLLPGRSDRDGAACAGDDEVSEPHPGAGNDQARKMHQR